MTFPEVFIIIVTFHIQKSSAVDLRCPNFAFHHIPSYTLCLVKQRLGCIIHTVSVLVPMCFRHLYPRPYL